MIRSAPGIVSPPPPARHPHSTPVLPLRVYRLANGPAVWDANSPSPPRPPGVPMRHRLAALVLVLVSAVPAAAGEPFTPDPAAVRRYGPAYRYPQNGWIVVHVEGEPFDRGYQHGRLLAAEIAGYVKALARQQSAKAPSDGWKLTRTLVGAAFLRKFDREYLEEMRGIADGAAAAGATFDGRPIDLLDVATANVAMEYFTLDGALEAQPTGLEGARFPRPPAPKCCPPPAKDHCSAFAATGPATADGKLVIGHITMSGLLNALYTNVWLDVKPAKGHRVLMQANPGGIWSAQDYYLTSAGIVLTETTIRQTRFDPDGTPLAGRARKAVQYGNSIDDVAAVLTEKNNGLYANEWLIGDANTNEIAMLELGTRSHRLRRSSKNDWLLPGVEGFYWGCNNTKDLAVRMETVPGVADRPHDLTWRPSDRDKAWLREYDRHRGKIDAAFGKRVFATPPLSAHPSLDAKVTTADLTKRLETHAVYGPPYARVWVPTFEDQTDYTGIKALVPNDWTVLTPDAPAAGEPMTLADVSERVPETDHDAATDDDPPTTPAWHGSFLPKTDADLWLAAGFAAYERVVALENALKDRAESGKPSPTDRDRIGLALFRYRADYLSAKANRPEWLTAAGRDTTPPALAAELDRDRWHREQVGYGVLALHALRGFLGDSAFVAAMDAFGRAHAGKEVTVAEFAAAVGRETEKDVAGFLGRWAADPPAGGPAFTTTAWLGDPEHVVIVYGTTADAAANEAAARKLQEDIRVRWSNITVPVVPDTAEVELKGRHVVLVGRPAANARAKRFAAAFPVTFGPASMRVKDKLYAHEDTAVVAAGTNHADPRYSAVLIAGLSADATYRAPAGLLKKDNLPAEVLVLPNAGKPLPMVVTSVKGK